MGRRISIFSNEKTEMSCSINRFKFQGTVKASDSQAAKEMEARLKEMMAVRSSQDSGNFKARYEHPQPSGPSGPSGPPTLPALSPSTR